MWWTIAAGILNLALNAYDSFKKDAADGIFARDCLEKLLAALDLARLLIIKEAPGTPLAALDREVMQLTARFSEYERKEIEARAEWLCAETADAARLMHAMEAEIDCLDLNAFDDLEYAAKVFALYAVLLPLRAAALVECGETEQVQPVIDTACRYADSLYRALCRKSDAEFSPDYVTRRGKLIGPGKHLTQFGFTHKNTFELVGEVRPEDSPDAVINRARARLQLRKEVVFKAYPGAAPVLQLKEYIKNCGEDGVV